LLDGGWPAAFPLIRLARAPTDGMLKGFVHARLACGCLLAFRDGVEGSPVTVVVEQKGPGCNVSLHVRGVPVYDLRESLRPATRPLPAEEEEFGEEG
jgi:hypothetical protein